MPSGRDDRPAGSGLAAAVGIVDDETCRSGPAHSEDAHEGIEAGSPAEGHASVPGNGNLAHAVRVVEAVLFASPVPVKMSRLADHLPDGTDVAAVLAEVASQYEGRGVRLVSVAGGWMFQTAPDLAYLLERHTTQERRLSRAALETLAIIAYHQPCTRAEIEEVRGVATSKGTLDALMDIGWVRPRGRRRAPGRPVTYGTTDAFLAHFSLDGLKDLPGLAELKGAGLLDGNLPPDFQMPAPTDVAALMPDELPLGEAEDCVQNELDLQDGEMLMDDPEGDRAHGPAPGDVDRKAKKRK